MIGEVKIVEMMFRSNIVLIVGGNNNEKYPSNRLYIWDDNKVAMLGYLEFPSEIKAIKCNTRVILVVLIN